MSEAADASSPLRLGLVGSPNAGKTTLFNALTGLRARVGNYPGVTVERREGRVDIGSRPIVAIDLPGTYSLDPISPDEAVVTRVLSGEIPEVPAPDALIVVADACSLERSLLMVADVLRRDVPACLVVTMVDELSARGGALDLPRLEAALGVPVIGVVGHRGLGLDRLRALIGAPEQWSRPAVSPPEDRYERSGWVASVIEAVVTERAGRNALTERIDRVVLHPVWGTALFATVMVTFFQLIFAWATPAMDYIDGAVSEVGTSVRAAVGAGLLADFLADGVVAGVGSVIIFLPQILLLFSLLYLLEDIGYMARAAFVVDRAMGRIGLEGRSFVALLSSYACAVPGIMATRTIPSPRDRLVTILVAPLMTCSARLPVYALLIGAFVPATTVWGPVGLQGLTLLGLYLFGGGSALFAAALLKRTLLPGEGLPFTMELPSYRWPTFGLWASQVWGSAWSFLRRAGTIILAGDDAALGAADLSSGRPTHRRVTRASSRARARTQRGGPHGARARTADRTARLRLEDRRGARREPCRARGHRRDAGADLRLGRRRRVAARGRAKRCRSANGCEGLQPGNSRLAARVLRLRAPVHVDARHDATRDQLVALARLRVRLPARARLGSQFRDVPTGWGARLASSCAACNFAQWLTRFSVG